MTIQLAQRQSERIRRAAGALALEYRELGRTPPGMTTAEHHDSIYQYGIDQADQAAATGAMTWVAAAERIADTYERLVHDMQEAGKP
ncbi:hypothetical protein M3G54_01655 [Brevibacterium casei]|uniref:hypothetical protein n=1 Tax=Brevibacterium casei TaxID=33889 RepID=UPI00223AB25D|nr:hypothetical protein [Brevibacterium casei]MCT2357069.1 hypothetical protein [Brevibacterium casei]